MEEPVGLAGFRLREQLRQKQIGLALMSEVAFDAAVDPLQKSAAGVPTTGNNR